MMKCYKIILILFLGLFAIDTYGQQVQLQFINEESNTPIVGMTVYLKTTDGVTASGVTDGDGILRTNKVQPPFDVEAHHINFDKQQFRVSKGDKHTYRVKPAVTQMDDLTIQGDPYQNVSIDRELYVVDEISRAEIEQLAGNNLGDVLNYHMNIAITPDPSTGRSTVSMFGLTGEYVKILVDNVPIVSDNGSGNNIDITQIGLENVERIEIAEGSMGVLYGSNAVAGVINIITKKGGASNWNIKTSLQEETIGREYDFFNEGRHIQNISVSHNVSECLFTSAGFRRNDFSGFFNGYKGKNHIVSSTETTKERGHEWNPKKQFSINGLVNYQFSDKMGAFYKYDFYNEHLDIYDRHVVSGEGLAGVEYTSTDELYATQRHSHQLNIDGELSKKIDFNFLFSYQDQKRKYEDYTYNIARRIKTSTSGLLPNQTSQVYFSKGTVNMPIHPNHLNMTLGYEYEHQKGYDAIASGRSSDSIARQTLRYKDIFTSLLLFPKSNINVTPGFRFNINSRYQNHLIWSITTNIRLTKNMDTKFVLGSAYKTPGYTQLFLYFVDANHNVTGNPSLKPEDGISVLWTTSNQSSIGRVALKSSLKAYYFNIQDKIALATIVEDKPDSPTDIQRSTYLNINEYKSTGVSIDNTIQYNKLQFSVGLEYWGTSQSIDGTLDRSDYLFRWNARSQMAYEIPKTGIKLFWNLKHNGGGERYFDNGNGVYKGRIDGFSMMDISIRKSMLNNTLRYTLGSRNIMDVVSINRSILPESGHDGASTSSQLIAYGRSFYLKLEYNLNFD